jgi:hypothetical protein
VVFGMGVTSPPKIEENSTAERVASEAKRAEEPTSSASGPELQPVRTETRWRQEAAGAILLLLGMAILASWVAWVADPTRSLLPEGIATIADGHYALFLLAAESVMAIAALAGGWGVLRGYWWGTRVSHVAIGLMLYSTIYTLGGSLVSEPFLTPIMLGGLAGTLIALGLLWQSDIGESFNLDPSSRAEAPAAIDHVALRQGLIRAGGVISLLFGVMHVLFWQTLDWPRSLDVLTADTAGIVQTLNASIAATMLVFAFVSLFHARELLTPGLGRNLSLAIALFWVARAAAGVAFFGYSPDGLLVFLAVAALYAAPQMEFKAHASAESG